MHSGGTQAASQARAANWGNACGNLANNRSCAAHPHGCCPGAGQSTQHPNNTHKRDLLSSPLTCVTSKTFRLGCRNTERR